MKKRSLKEMQYNKRSQKLKSKQREWNMQQNNNTNKVIQKETMMMNPDSIPTYEK